MHRTASFASSMVLVVAVGCASPSQRAQMSTQTLASAAAEGARLAGLIVQDDAGGTFARAHAQELADDVEKVEQDVADHETPGGKRLLDLADQVDTVLGEMTVHPTDHAIARDAQKELTKLATEIAKAGT